MITSENLGRPFSEFVALSNKFNVFSEKIAFPVFGNRKLKELNTLKTNDVSNEGGHWALVILRFDEEKAIYIDSLGEKNEFISQDAVESFSLELMKEISSWRIDDVSETINFEYFPSQSKFLLLSN